MHPVDPEQSPTDMHTIRLKVGEAEFELIGTMEQVSTAWKALQSAVVGAMKPSAPTKPMRARNAAGTTEAAAPRRERRPARRTPAPKGGRSERPDVMEKLVKADFATFPDLPSDAKSLYVGLATLRWARDQHGIDGLALTELQKFLAEKASRTQPVEAYRSAFKQLRAGEVHSTGSPKVYRLMAPGEKLLDAYLQTVAPSESEQTPGTNGARSSNGSEQTTAPNRSEQPFTPNGLERVPAPNGPEQPTAANSSEQPTAANSSEKDTEHPVAAADQQA
jgi:hypothetical protein